MPYDPDDRKKISEYTRNPQKQDEIRRKYLTKDLIGNRLILITHRGKLEILNRDLIRIVDEYGPWLEYSDKVHKALCLCCYIFKYYNKGQARLAHLQLTTGTVGTGKADYILIMVRLMLLAFIMQ